MKRKNVLTLAQFIEESRNMSHGARLKGRALKH